LFVATQKPILIHHPVPQQSLPTIVISQSAIPVESPANKHRTLQLGCVFIATFLLAVAKTGPTGGY
jgi:hypothetical protein